MFSAIHRTGLNLECSSRFRDISIAARWCGIICMIKFCDMLHPSCALLISSIIVSRISRQRRRYSAAPLSVVFIGGSFQNFDVLLYALQRFPVNISRNFGYYISTNRIAERFPMPSQKKFKKIRFFSKKLLTNRVSCDIILFVKSPG